MGPFCLENFVEFGLFLYLLSDRFQKYFLKSDFTNNLYNIFPKKGDFLIFTYFPDNKLYITWHSIFRKDEHNIFLYNKIIRL